MRHSAATSIRARNNIQRRERDWGILTAVLVLGLILVVVSQPGCARGDEPWQDAKLPRNGTVHNKRPIIWVILDEMALVDLLAADGEIDARRFPNIAAFASNATWYTNATTVHYATTWAIPPILTGTRPDKDALPRIEDYPRNLFTLLDREYEFNVIEPVTTMSAIERRPKSDYAAFEATGSPLWEAHTGRMWDSIKSDRKSTFYSFVQALNASPTPTLHFLHIVLPHRPAFFLPSGQHFLKTQRMTGVHEEPQTKIWIGSQTAVDKMHQRHLLQMGFVDTLWGDLIKKLKTLGIFDESLIILVADHGISYRTGMSNRRPQKDNFGEIAFVPLMIKYPHQEIAAKDVTNVETIDILPTLVDVLDIDTTWKFDGRSLIGSEKARAHKVLPKGGGEVLRLDPDRYLVARRRAHERVVQAFRLSNPRASFYDFEDGMELVGQPLVSLANRRKRCRVQSASLGRTNNIRPTDDYLPVRISGRIICAEEVRSPLLIFSCKGVVAGTTRPFTHENNLIFEYVLNAERLQENSPVRGWVIEYPRDAERGSLP